MASELFTVEPRLLGEGEIEKLKKLLTENRRAEEARQTAENAEAEEFLRHSYLAVSEKKYYEAQLNLKYALSRYPKNALIAFNLANIHFSCNETAEAEKYYFRAIKLSPCHYLAHINLGILYVGEGKLKAAEKCFERALIINAEKPAAYLNLANIYTLQNRAADAEKYYKNVLTLDPSNIDAALNLAPIYDERGELNKSEEIFRAALKHHKNHPALLAGLANTLYLRRRYDDALTVLNKVKQLKLDLFDAHITSAKIYLALNKLGEAEQTLRVAEELDISNYRTHRWLGNLYTSKGQFVLAERSFKTALNLNPSSADTRKDFAVMLELSGRPKEAEKILKGEK